MSWRFLRRGVLLLERMRRRQAVQRAGPEPGRQLFGPRARLVASVPRPGSHPDPLLSGYRSGFRPPTRCSAPMRTAAQNDPLAGSDPLKGRAMPTEHSHWLRGRIREARLTVLLNGVRQGEYSGVVDQDITMKLRQGSTRSRSSMRRASADASAQMDLLESEHDPPIAPLAAFQSLPQAPTRQA